LKKQSEKTAEVTTYTFYCAQLAGEQTKQKRTETGKRRARMTMDRYKCGGWLILTINENELASVGIRLTHHRQHPPYTDISILEDIVKEIERLKDLTAAKVS
jgi:hypothetical protein